MLIKSLSIQWILLVYFCNYLHCSIKYVIVQKIKGKLLKYKLKCRVMDIYEKYVIKCLHDCVAEIIVGRNIKCAGCKEEKFYDFARKRKNHHGFSGDSG